MKDTTTKTDRPTVRVQAIISANNHDKLLEQGHRLNRSVSFVIAQAVNEYFRGVVNNG